MSSSTPSMANLQMVIPAGKKVEAQYVEMKVPLYSFGCENKVKKALSSLRGIHSVEVEYRVQKVRVWGICDKYDVLAAIRKKRRGARFWEESPEPEPEEEEVAAGEDVKAGEDAINKAGEHGITYDLRQIKAMNRSYKMFRFRKSWKKLLPMLLI